MDLIPKASAIFFSNFIDHKNVVSYSGDIYDQKDVTKLFKHLDRFISWAKEILE